MADPETIGKRAVALGILSDEQAARAVAGFRQTQAQGSFVDFLLRSGVVDPGRAQRLEGTDGEPAGGAPADAADVTLMDAGPDGGEGAGADPLVGTAWSGFVVERKIGQGGMGSVYLGRRAEPTGAVTVGVVKFLAPEQAKNRQWRGRFEREARVLAGLDHPNIVGLFAVDAEGDHPHLVMEYVDGEPLDAALAARGAFPPLEAARIARDVCLALAAAHAKGVIHRDIKPANVMLARSGAVKVLDFGLAKAVSVDDGLSLPGQALGTPHYMAPEQWGDHQVDARADVFSAGATLYHLLTGVLPFPGDNAQAIARKAAEGEFERPRALVPDAPPALEHVLLRMMDPERRFRFATAEGAARALEQVLAGATVDVPRLEGEGGVVHALVGGRAFAVGRDPGCAVALGDASVSRRHAVIERTKTGFLLRDEGSSYGTWVSDMRVREVVLKDGDLVRFGRVACTFRDAGLSVSAAHTTRKLAVEVLRVSEVAEPILRALVDEGDKRVIVALLEDLAPDAIPRRAAAARAAVLPHLGGDVAEQLGKKLEARLRRARNQVPMRLFSLTHENLGDDVEAWLAWWEGARDRFPAQLALRAPKARARLQVVKGEPEPRTIELGDRVFWTVGRDEGSHVLLDSRTVSRLHATLVRYHGRIAVRDAGSRFGTLLDGHRVRVAFLGHGARLVLGKVELVYEEEPAGASSTIGFDGVHALDGEAFAALEELEHPATATALVRFVVDDAERQGWIDQAAQRLFNEPEKVAAFAERVRKAYARRAERARQLLPKLLGRGDAGLDGRAWNELLAAYDDEVGLPAQFVPRGWIEGDLTS